MFFFPGYSIHESSEDIKKNGNECEKESVSMPFQNDLANKTPTDSLEIVARSSDSTWHFCGADLLEYLLQYNGNIFAKDVVEIIVGNGWHSLWESKFGGVLSISRIEKEFPKIAASLDKEFIFEEILFLLVADMIEKPSQFDMSGFLFAGQCLYAFYAKESGNCNSPQSIPARLLDPCFKRFALESIFEKNVRECFGLSDYPADLYEIVS